MMIKALVVGGTAAYVAWRHAQWKRRRPSPAAEDLAKSIRAEMSMDADFVGETDSPLDEQGRARKAWALRRVPLAARLANEAKERFGPLDCPTEADRIAVRRFIKDSADRIEDLRKQDKAKVIPLAYAAFWMKTEDEILGREIECSVTAAQSRARYNAVDGRNFVQHLLGRRPGISGY
uniref:Tombusvirus p33 domain-containing protein n=1 Tax=Riboviria sp. TaxID=2585031 RepID=A0A8K1HHN9_9VIRU|nr:hypothetical protein 1 [Riboviria sp.]